MLFRTEMKPMVLASGHKLTMNLGRVLGVIYMLAEVVGQGGGKITHYRRRLLYQFSNY